jgi:general secretion pathway protein D
MIKADAKMHKYITLILGLSLCAVLQLQAQRTQGITRNTGSGTGAGGRGFGSTGAGGAREYYNSGMVGEAIISSDPETRSLIVITDEETSQYISQVITNLDQPKPQVLIKVVFLEVTYRDGYDIGIEGGTRQDPNSTTTALASNVFGLAGQGTSPIPPGAGLYQVMGTDYEVTLRAIATAGKTEVLSRPSILARNNQQAVITVGQEIPFITDTRFDALNNQINTVQYQDIGIILRVTPFITSDGMVEMIVSPEISNLTDETVPISGGSNPVASPVIAKRSADTVVVTPDAQTVVIGGLMQTDKTEAVSKIPFLGDIPLLGLLFRRTVEQNIKKELIIFLTPHIVPNPTELVGLSAAERANAEFAPDAFSEEKLQRFLDRLPDKEPGSEGADGADPSKHEGKSGDEE